MTAAVAAADRTAAEADADRAHLFRTTALVIFAQSVLAVVAFVGLSAVFEFPDILREPAGDVLAKFSEDPTAIRTYYYLFTLSSVAFIPVAVLLHKTLAGKTLAGGRAASGPLTVATTFGVAMAITQIIGFVRWPIMVPYLAETYADPAASQATRDAVAVTYEAFNRYSGMAVGENVGFVLQGLWGLLLAGALARSPLFPRWAAPVGALSAAAVLVSTLEQFRFGAEDALGLVNAVGVTAFNFWLVALGVVLLLRARARGRGRAA